MYGNSLSPKQKNAASLVLLKDIQWIGTEHTDGENLSIIYNFFQFCVIL